MKVLAILILASVLCSIITAYVILDFLQMRCERELKGKRYVAFLLLGALLIGTIGAMDYPLFRSICILMFTCAMGIGYFHQKGKEIIQNLLFSIIISLCDVITLPFFLWTFWQLSLSLYSNLLLNIAMLLISQLLLLYVYHIFRKFYFHDTYDTPLGVQLLSFVFLPIFSLLQCLMLLNETTFVANAFTYFYFFASILFLVFLNVYQFYSIHVISQNVRLKQELYLYEEKNRMQLAYYERLEENEKESRKFRHDVKRHLETMEQALKNQEDMERYAADFKDMMKDLTLEHFSNHRILNIILQEKSRQAKDANITFRCELPPLDLDFMRDIDVTTIFANLLDNALEASAMVKDAPMILIRADQIHDFLVVSIENTVGKDGKPTHEGLGLKNVTQTLKRYGGDIQCMSEEGCFRVNLYIAMK